jgi:hypothetical protein
VDKPTLAILLTFVVHVLGIGALFWLAFDGSHFDWRSWWPGDEGGNGGSEPPAGPGGGPGGNTLPLPSADPAALRLRTEHERLADVRRRTRRPVHEPEPGRVREPA